MDKASDRMVTKNREEKERWTDNITTYIDTTWARTAQDRGRWQLHEEGYIRQ